MKPKQILGSSAVRWALLVAIVGLGLRLGLWMVYGPASFGDTPSYMRLATALAEGGLSGYDATRVPGYPVFLALLGRSPGIVWPAQLALGWTISMMLFVFTWKTSGNPATGAVVGLLYNFLPGQFLFESNLLSETLTAAFLIVSLTFLVRMDRTESQRSTYLFAIAMGISTSLAALVRPLFFLLPVWLILFVWFGPHGRDLGVAASFGVVPAIMLGAWLAWVYTTYGMISPTTMGGYHLVQHTGAYFEFLPDEVAPLRDTYLEYRDAQIAARGTQTNAIWDAIPEMSEVSGLSFFALSAELQRLSLQLIRRHPDLYLANVAQGWIDFWKAPVYWDRAGFQSNTLGSGFNAWVIAGRGITLLTNAAFLAGTLAVVLSRRMRERIGVDRYILATGGLVWVSSVFQTLVDHGDNPRFLIPLQMLVTYVVVRWAWEWKKYKPDKTR